MWTSLLGWHACHVWNCRDAIVLVALGLVNHGNTRIHRQKWWWVVISSVRFLMETPFAAWAASGEGKGSCADAKPYKPDCARTIWLFAAAYILISQSVYVIMITNDKMHVLISNPASSGFHNPHLSLLLLKIFFLNCINNWYSFYSQTERRVKVFQWRHSWTERRWRSHPPR